MNYKYIFQLPNKKLVHNSWPLHTINFFLLSITITFYSSEGETAYFSNSFPRKICLLLMMFSSTSLNRTVFSPARNHISWKYKKNNHFFLVDCIFVPPPPQVNIVLYFFCILTIKINLLIYKKQLI